MIELDVFSRFAKVYEAGRIIFSEFEPGDSFYMIQSGSVRISKIVGDSDKTLDTLSAPEIFGEMAILEGAPRSATATAITHSKILEFNRANFEILLIGNPLISFRLLRLFTKRIWDQKRRFMILTLSDPQARVADVFLMLDETEAVARGGELEGEKREFSVNLDNVANWAGLPISETQAILNHFSNQRRIELLVDKIQVKNINDFRRFVGSQRKHK